MAELLSMEEALRLVLERVRPLAAERVALDEARGRVLAEPAVAAVDLPPFDSSAMDGFAVRAEDTPGELPVVFRIAAGRPSPHGLGPGQAMGIATGAAVPRAPMPSSHSSMLSIMTTQWQSISASSLVHPYAPAEAMHVVATSSSPQASGSGRLSSARWQLQAWRRSRARAARAPPS